ncbi:MAG: hypothetical protein MUE42_11430 [Opitutaceae bacterium]|jgi:hypothetical protein|nr:hypothetical protein [Opitutaceae bacterium]
MKTALLPALVYGLSALSASAAEPQNLIVNGDFQTGKTPAFHSTPPWYNRGTGLNQGSSARKDAAGPGVFVAIVNDRYDAAAAKFGPVAHTQKTAYVIQAGDRFNLAYEWSPADIYWQKGRDTLRFVLYATADDKIGSPVVWSSVHTADFFTGNIEMMKYATFQTEPVNEAAVGKKLILCFHGMDTVDGTTGNTHFARVDNIVVTAEPATK